MSACTTCTRAPSEECLSLPGPPQELFRLPPEASKSFSPDGTIQLLDKFAQEHAILRALMQQHHDVLTQKIESISLPLPFVQAPISPSPPMCGECSPGNPSNSSPSPLAPVGVLEEPVLPAYPASSVVATAPTGAAWIGLGLQQESKENLTPKPEVPWITELVLSTRFEIVMGLVIVANTCTMFANLELKGRHEAYNLGLRSSDNYVSNHKTSFDIIEYMFNSLYLLELVLRVWVHGSHFLKSMMNGFDALVVLASCVDCFVLTAFNLQGRLNLSVLRLVRVCRIFRVLKFLRASQHFSEMRVLLSTLRMALRGCVWVFLLLFGIIVGGGILMAQIILDLLDDESISTEIRIWLFEGFGTSTRAIYTMFECTFTGGWRFYARPLIEDVSPFFALFWVVWIVGVNFVTMRVAAALFLKQTLAVAAADEERLAMEHMKMRNKFAGCLREVFQTADISGDGAISKDEFDRMILDDDIVAHFRELDLDIDEVTALFSVLSSDDGDADYEEFLAGALKMNCAARTLDSVHVMHNQLKIARRVENVIELLEPLMKLISTQHSRPG